MKNSKRGEKANGDDKSSGLVTTDIAREGKRQPGPFSLKLEEFSNFTVNLWRFCTGDDYMANTRLENITYPNCAAMVYEIGLSHNLVFQNFSEQGTIAAHIHSSLHRPYEGTYTNLILTF